MLNLEDEKSKFRFKMNLNIRWGDMDAMRHVNNAVYLTYFEEARIYYFGDALQLNPSEIRFILASVHIDYLKPMIFPNPAFIYTRISKFGIKSMEMHHLVTSIVNGNEELSAKGYSVLVSFDYKTNQTVLTPESLKEKIRDYEIIKP